MKAKDGKYVITLRLSKEDRRVFRLLAASMDLDISEMVVATVREKAKTLDAQQLVASLEHPLTVDRLEAAPRSEVAPADPLEVSGTH